MDIKKRKEIEDKYVPKYTKVFNGIERCMICGIPFALCEKMFHSFQHTAFINCKLEYKELLTYEETLKAQEENIEILKTLQGDNIIMVSKEKERYIEKYLNNLYLINFSYSHLFWGYSKENHPNFSNYIALLWNTESFELKIRKELGREVFNKNIPKYIGDFGLKESDIIFESGFVFIKEENKERRRLA